MKATPLGPNVGVIKPKNTGTPPIAGDRDASCHTISYPIHDGGTMYPSELAYIRTGIPWRTFWLEPQPGTESSFVPDWLAVDLFSATDSNNVPGRININARMDNGNPSFPVRTQPLNALLSGNPAAATVVSSIYNFTLDAPPLPSFLPWPDKSFTTAGQICEVSGLADSGSPTPKSTREAPARYCQSGYAAFGHVYDLAIAQSIKKVNLISACG